VIVLSYNNIFLTIHFHKILEVPNIDNNYK